MARDENPPFLPGETYFGGATISADDVTATKYLEGKEWVSEDLDYSVQGAKALRSGKLVRRRCVRNNSGIALLPKRLAQLEATAGDYGGRVDGYADVTSERAYPIDEFLPTAGVPDDDLFWIVVEGPATCLTDLAGGANNVLNVGEAVVALTAATSQATTAGRVRPIDLNVATTALGDAIRHTIGRALSAKTTANTNADVLVDVGKW